MSRERVFGLDAMRALAILLVLVAHSRQLLSGAVAEGIRLAWGGMFGVDLFFALSGFLIGSILISHGPSLREPRTLARFWARRWMRTLPNYFLFLLLNVGVFLAIGGGIPRILRYLVFAQSLWKPHPGFFPESWSLCVEEWFYLTFPICVCLGLRIFRRFDVALVGSAVLYLVTPLVLRFAWAGLPWSEGYRQVVIFRLDAVMYGVLAAWISRAWPGAWCGSRWALAIAGVAMIVGLRWYSLRVPVDSDLFMRTGLLSLSPLACAMLLPLCSQWNVAVENVWTRAVRRIALWSYSLYLCHHGLMVLLVENGLRGAWVWFVYMPASIAIAAAAYHFYEKPILDLRDARSRREHDADPVAAPRAG